MTLNDVDCKNPVLRVTQLDTAELDETLLSNIKSSLNEDFFKYIQLNFFQKYHAEIFSAFKFILWYNTYGKNEQTVGQSILDWSYDNDKRNSSILNPVVKKTLHALIYCLDEWFAEKFISYIEIFFNFICRLILRKKCLNESQQEDLYRKNSRKIRKLANILVSFIKIASFLNYILFLFNGKYLTIWERLFRFRPVYKKTQFMRDINSESSIREELWYSFFTLFKISDSFLNFKKLITKILKKLNVTNSNHSNNIKSNEIDLSKCGICLNQPTTAHRSKFSSLETNCKHIFCYMCIKKFLSENDSQTNCPICFKLINDVELYVENEGIL